MKLQEHGDQGLIHDGLCFLTGQINIAGVYLTYTRMVINDHSFFFFCSVDAAGLDDPETSQNYAR